MTRIQNYFEHIALSIAMGGAMCIFAGSATAQTNSCMDIRGAQQQLKTGGYYKGAVDGRNGQMTRSAIRQYQRENGLNTNGQLDNVTCNKLLGMQGTGEANRSTTGAQTTQSNSANANSRNNANGNGSNTQGMNGANNNSGSNPPAMSNAEFKANVQSAQRQLKQKGLYTGNINGVMDSNTETAIRKYQENTGLNVTGRLDQTTLNSLGILKSH